MAEPAHATGELRKIERAIIKLRNKMNRADLNYTCQVSVNSADPQNVSWAAQITAPAEGLAPVTFISVVSANDLINQIKEQTKFIDYDEIEKAYHKAQIEACKRTIQMHEERIENIINPKPDEDENLPVEDGAEAPVN